MRSDAGLCLCFLRLNRKAPVQWIRSARRRITNAGQTRHESREQCHKTRRFRICSYFFTGPLLTNKFFVVLQPRKGRNKSERERDGKKDRDGGGGGRPQGALFLTAVPAIIYARFRGAWVMGSGYS